MLLLLCFDRNKCGTHYGRTHKPFDLTQSSTCHSWSYFSGSCDHCTCQALNYVRFASDSTSFPALAPL
uniref:Uncharacterized protein n=1 Tax=Hyaloperonospora arabidopsidis (strain Emoy2) TaxID=559515 RepID=M4BUS1_HYAAE